MQIICTHRKYWVLKAQQHIILEICIYLQNKTIASSSAQRAKQAKNTDLRHGNGLKVLHSASE
jgi:hypothetical protein